MIKGSFTSATGVIDIEFNDGLVPVTDMDITQIGELSYSFDITPESVTIDRLLALYSNLKFSFNGINQIGVDVYEAMVAKLVDANRTVYIVITTHDGQTYGFRFECSINDLDIDERTGIASLLCKPYISNVTFKDVFDSIDNTLKVPYRKGTLAPVEYIFYDAVGVSLWIKHALPMIFGNSYPVISAFSKSGLSTVSYTEDIYSDSFFEGQSAFCLVDMGDGFAPTDEAIRVDAIEGTITCTADLTARPPKDSSTDPVVTVRGLGTTFTTSMVGKNIYYFSNDVPIALGVVTRFNNTTSLEVSLLSESIDIAGVGAGFETSILPNQRPAIDVLKELAGIEGSVFGSGFSQNFYINRLADTQTSVDIDYDNVINAKLSRTSLYLGNSIVTQLGVQTSRLVNRVKKKKSFWDKLFGRQRFSTEVSELPDDPYGTYPSLTGDPARLQLPVLDRVTSGNIGNPRASKELRIELAPAYPLLSKGKAGTSFIGYIGQVVLAADGNGVKGDLSLESTLTANGLRNYLRALSSVDGDFVIDFEIKGAFSVKPYETFRFTNAPERYQGKTYRVSEARYNVLTDTVKIKGYKINGFTVDTVPSGQRVENINVSTGILDFSWDTTKPVVAFFDVASTGVDGSLEIASSGSFYSINTEPTDNLWGNSITLNTDGYGKVARRIYVRFSPSAAGIVSDSFLYGTIQVKGKSQTAQVELRAKVIAPQSEFYIGQVDGIIGGDTVSNITANMFTEIEQGREITLVGENKGYRYTITPTEDVFTGDNTFAIEEQFIEKDRYHVEVSQNADRTGITVSEREIVLKVRGDGRIAAIRLSADADSATTEINIVADQVKINDINFVSNGGAPTANTGYIESNLYSPGVSGWRIGGTGNAEFGNVVIRGSLSTSNIVGDLTMSTGVIRNVSGNLRINPNGIELNPGTTLSPTGGASVYFETLNQIGFLSALNNLADTELDVVLRGGFILTLGTNNYNSAIVITESAGGRVDVALRALFSNQIDSSDTTDSISAGTGSIITAGGVGIAKRLNVGGALNAPIVTVKAVVSVSTPYTVLATDTHIAVDNGASAFTVNLPAGTEGRKVTIYDNIGGAGVGSEITINRASTDTINGATSIQLSTQYESATLLFSGTNWTRI
jgi:hypothetical protein